MRKLSHLRRRRFLGLTAMAAASGATVACSRSGGRWRVLTDEEATIAAAACDQIIPADEFPGAAEAGAVEFIDRQLSGHLAQNLAIYRKGLADLQRVSFERHGKPFAELDSAPQTALLHSIEKSRFFGLLLANTMQSYYGDPRHGGNRDEAGYRSIGVPIAQVRGRSQHNLVQLEKAE